MSEGGATEVGSIVAYLTLDRSGWNREVRATEDDARKLAGLSPTIRIETNAPTVLQQLVGVRAAANDVGRQSPHLRVSSNAAEQTFQMHALRDAILLLGPAAVPVSAVLTGAMVGVLPALAAVVLGIKGISEMEKAGRLQGTQYAADIRSVKSELSTLKSEAAGGILNGFHQALGDSKPLFKEVNTDIGVMSGQLGQIVAGAAPAFVSIFTQLNPLFVTFGQQLVSGAGHLETWATSSNGISKFVTYAQTELPVVEHDIGQVLAAAVHLTAGLAPMGNVALNSLGLVAHLINLIDPKHLADVESVLISGYAAWRTYGAVSSLVASRVEANAARLAAASLLEARAKTEQAATEAAADLEMARADAARTQAATEAAMNAAIAAEQSGADDRALAQLIAENSIVYADAMRARAVAAEESAAATAAAAKTAADAVVASGAEAATGWSAALGPLAAVGLGVGLLTAIFATNSSAAQKNTADVNDYTAALVASKGAIDDTVKASAAKKLADAGALDAAEKLGISLTDVEAAATGNAAALAKVREEVLAATGPIVTTSAGVAKLTDAQKAAIDPAATLTSALNDQSAAFGTAQTKAQLQLEALAETKVATDDLTGAERSYSAAVTTAVTAVLALGQTQLAQAQTEDAFKEGVLNMAAAVKQNGASLSESTSKGLANRDMLIGLLQQAQNIADAQSKNHVGNGTILKDYQANITAIQAMAVHLGLSKTAVANMIAEMHLTPKDIATTFTLDTSAAAAKLAAIQAMWRALEGSQASAKHGDLADVHAHASGGAVADGWFTVGEQGYELGYKRGSQVEIFSNTQSKRMTGKDRLPGYATGTGATLMSDSAALVALAAAMATSASALKSSADSLDSAAKDAHISSTSLHAVSLLQGKLLADASARDKIRAQLGTPSTAGSTAYDRLSAAQQAYAATRSSAAGAITGSYDFGAISPQAGSNVNAQDFVDAGRNAVNNAAAFAADIKNLEGRGLNSADVQSLVAKGPAALAAANALVHSTAAQLAQINAERAALASIAAGLGTSVANAADGSVVKAAQTVVNGLLAHEKLLTTAMVNLAKSISGKLAGHNAGGTENWSGGWTWVGEQGPELMNLPSGSKIRSNSASRRMMQGAGGGAGGGSMPAVYVQNPFTGEYLLAKVTGIADDLDARQAREFQTLGDWG